MSNIELIRSDAEEAISNRLARSKRIGQSLAAVAVAAGIALGLSSNNDDVPIVASELALVGTMGAGLTEAVASKRNCSRIVEGYRRVVEKSISSDPETPPESNGQATSEKGKAIRAGRFAFRQVEKLLPLNGAFMPLMTYYGSTTVANYARWGGNILPSNMSALLSPHNTSQVFDPGLAFGTLMMAEGTWLLSSGLGSFESYYQRQLDAIDGVQPDEQPTAA